MQRLTAAIALALTLCCSLATPAAACVNDRYPHLNCDTGLPIGAGATRGDRGVDANGNALRYGGLVDAAAWSAGVSPQLAHAMVRLESNYNPRVRGAAGEWGIGQIKCQSARKVGFAGSCGQLADATTNLRYAMAYLKLAIDKGGGNCAGVSLYNLGLAARPRCTAYGRKLMRLTGR